MENYFLPIKKQYCDQIFTKQTKFFEFRKHFDASFKGYCFVYESGTDGRHKVIGYFYTERIAKVEPGVLIPQDFDDLLDSLPDEKVEEVLTYGEPIYCIPIIHPIRFKVPLEIRKFCLLANTNEVFEKPPQSRKKIETLYINDLGAIEYVERETYNGRLKAPFI